MLLRRHGELARILRIDVFDFAAPPAHLGVEFVAQDGEQPGLQVGAQLERRLMGPSLGQRFLNEVVGAFAVADQCDAECPEARNGFQKLFPKLL